MSALRRPAPVLLCLLAFLAGLALAWAHPAELQHPPDHACGGEPHLAPGQGPSHHDEHTCPACELLAEAALVPDLAPPALAALEPRERAASPALDLGRATAFSSYFSRGPPA